MIGTGYVVKISDFGLSSFNRAEGARKPKLSGKRSYKKISSSSSSGIREPLLTDSIKGRNMNPVISSINKDGSNENWGLNASTTMIGTPGFMAPGSTF